MINYCVFKKVKGVPRSTVIKAHPLYCQEGSGAAVADDLITLAEEAAAIDVENAMNENRDQKGGPGQGGGGSGHGGGGGSTHPAAPATFGASNVELPAFKPGSSADHPLVSTRIFALN